MASVKSILKKVNSMPFSFTMKHYYSFGNTTSSLKDDKLDSGESWDVLRMSHPDFSISQKREEWLKASELEIRKDGQDNGLIQRAKDIVSLINKLKFNSLFSIGVGGAGLEYQIKKHKPELRVICSEYSEVNVNLLKKVFIEADSIIQFDITTKAWPTELVGEESSLCMIYRIDASFTDAEWRRIFESMHSSGVKNVLYIPTNFLTMLSIFFRLKRRVGWIVTGQRFSFSGYLRTKNTFQDFWKDLYTEEFLDFGGLKGFLLKIK